MASPISKFAPTAVVFAAASYCVWPYVFPSSDAAGKQAAAMPEIARPQLSPVIMPPPLAILSGRADEPIGKKATPASPTGAIASRSRSAAHGKTAAPADPLSGLALGATSIFAAQRLAIINGRDLRGARAAQEQGPIGPAVRRRPDPARPGAPGM